MTDAVPPRNEPVVLPSQGEPAGLSGVVPPVDTSAGKAPAAGLERLAADIKKLIRRMAGSQALRPTARRLTPVYRQVRRSWGRSIQLRMVTITVLSSSLLVGGFGYLVADRSTDALLNGAKSDAKRQVDAGLLHARSTLNTQYRYDDPGTQGELKALLPRLADRPQQGGEVVVAMRVKSEDSPFARSSTDSLVYPEERTELNSAISTELDHEISVTGNQAYEIVTVDLGGSASSTYLIYGSPVPAAWPGKTAALYYFFPLDTEVLVAEDFRTTVTYVGSVLVLLLAMVVALVTRAMVTPVRLAARTAQRLSAGLLDQRMIVKGEDELALLADAFNQMAANLQRQIVRLEEMSRLQRRFTSDVSHELRTPLTTVRMAADLLHAERDQFDPAVARSAELLQTELDRFEELLSDLLEISRFDAGFAMLDSEPTDLVSIVNRVAERLTPVANRVGIELQVVAPDPPVIAEIDPRRVERILRNLVGNALDHGEGRPVVVTLGADQHAVAVTVRDHGVGLKAGEDKLVFNRFWRADPSRARQTGGTGLGLSISLEDARLHGGWLEAWGQPGQGAAFRLTLPVRSGAKLLTSPVPLIPVPIEQGLVEPQAAGSEPAGSEAVGSEQVMAEAESPARAPIAASSEVIA